jgi:hypothetical protein
MILFLPILLLGFTQAADQPVSQAANPPQMRETEAAVLNPPKLTFPYTPSKNNVFVRPEAKKVLNGQIVLDDPRSEDSNVCFTMRSYLFERRDGFAPEPVGMTTCQPASARKQKRVTGKARLVPAN